MTIKEKVKKDVHVQHLPEINSYLGDSQIISSIGEGVNSIVYKVWNEPLGIYRAIKVLKRSASETAKRRFSQEIRILAQLCHSNLLNIHRVGLWRGLTYFETDYIHGNSLADMISEKRALPLNLSLAIAIELSRALIYVHDRKVTINNTVYTELIHRDLKPSNILISPYTGLRLIDFGIASLSQNHRHSTSEGGKIAGSMPYLAPEMLTDQSATVQSDIYSFGTILYEMLTGVRAFPDEEMPRLIRRRMKNRYTPLQQMRRELPKKLISLVFEMLEEMPSKRPQSIKEIRQILEKIYSKNFSESPESVITSSTDHPAAQQSHTGSHSLEGKSESIISMVANFTCSDTQR